MLSSTAKTKLERWRDDPVLFARACLGFEAWSRQAELMHAINRYSRVAVKSGHKIGKSSSAASIGLWFWTTRPGARVIMTSSSARQVREILWRELKLIYQRSKMPLGGHMNETPSAGLRHPDGSEIVGFSTDDAEKMAGISGANVLFIVDEASGVKKPIFDAIEGNRAGGARVVYLSNPTRTSGEFFDAFHAKRHFYKTMTVSSEDTPNVLAKDMVVPGLATHEYIAEKRAEWGGRQYRDHPLYRVRILGLFPRQEAAAIIALDDLMRGVETWEPDEGPETSGLDVGFDVARYGDDETVLFFRRGDYAPHEPVVLPQGDSLEVAARGLVAISDRLNDFERKHRDRVRIKVDAIGYGAGVYDQLAASASAHGFVVIPVNTAERATTDYNGIQYANLRAQLWFAAALWLKNGGRLPSDGKLEAELVEPKYKFDEQGRIKVESKEELKKEERIGRSPDRADAFCLTFAPDNGLVFDPSMPDDAPRPRA